MIFSLPTLSRVDESFVLIATNSFSSFLLNACCVTHPNLFVTGCTRKTRIIDVVYNASNNELVRTKTLVKNAIVVIDATPFRQWFEAHYALPIGRKKGAKLVSSSLLS